MPRASKSPCINMDACLSGMRFIAMSLTANRIAHKGDHRLLTAGGNRKLGRETPLDRQGASDEAGMAYRLDRARGASRGCPFCRSAAALRRRAAPPARTFSSGWNGPPVWMFAGCQSSGKWENTNGRERRDCIAEGRPQGSFGHVREIRDRTLHQGKAGAAHLPRLDGACPDRGGDFLSRRARGPSARTARICWTRRRSSTVR